MWPQNALKLAPQRGLKRALIRLVKGLFKLPYKAD